MFRKGHYVCLNMSNKNRRAFQAHPFHLVNPSPWPILTCVSLFNITSSLVLSIHGSRSAVYWLFLSVILLIVSMSLWFRDVISEGTYLGNHTLAVQRGLTLGVALFIVSEALFFLAVFWAYFHSSLSPTYVLGVQWPPKGIEAINAFELPLLNTVLLLGSGVTITLSHHCIIKSERNIALMGGIFTLALANFFTILQYLEYSVSSFSISDGIYGSCFYFGTGFHGIHVIIGTIFLAVGIARFTLYQITDNHHLGLESGIIYWHFVDIVWLFLFINIYWWGS